MIVFIFSFTLSAFGINTSQVVSESPSDTIYYLSFLDLVEKYGQYKTGGNYIRDFDLNAEREVMNDVIRKLMKKNFILFPVPDSCFKSLKIDSTSRRRVEFMKQICQKCSLTKNVIVLDALWQYLNRGSFRSIELSYGGTAPYWIIGTWWDVYAVVYSPIKQKFTLRVKKQYTQYQRRRPVKKWPGITHKRFFERPIKEVRKFLLNHS